MWGDCPLVITSPATHVNGRHEQGRRHFTFFIGLGPDLWKDWCVVTATLTLKVSLQPEPGPRFMGVFSLLQQIYLHNKKEQQSAEIIKGRLLEEWGLKVTLGWKKKLKSFDDLQTLGSGAKKKKKNPLLCMNDWMSYTQNDSLEDNKVCLRLMR